MELHDYVSITLTERILKLKNLSNTQKYIAHIIFRYALSMIIE